jgi:hypothetical protein
VVFAFRLNFFVTIDPIWSEANLLAVIDQEGSDRDALLSGFFANPKIGHALFGRLKPILLTLVMRRRSNPHVAQRDLSDVALLGWTILDNQTGERYVSNDEMRDVLLKADDSFRTHTLWSIGHWPSATDKITF